MAAKIQLRRDSASVWTSVNPTLALGEPGVETDTYKVKVGDGATAWTALPYTITTQFTDLNGKPTTIAGYGIADAYTKAQVDAIIESPSGNLTGSVFADDSTIMVDGVAATLNLANNTTADLPENTNLYYTNVRADARIAAAGITDLSDADQTVQTTDNVTFSSVTGNVITTQIDSGDSSAIEIQTDVDMLAGLTVGNHIIPSSNENIDLGSASARFRDLYLSGNSAVIGDLALKRHASGGLLVSDHSSGNATNLTTHDIVANNITTAGYLRGPASFVIDPAAFGDDTGTVVIAGNLQVDGTQTTINSTTVSIDDLNFSIATDAADSAAANGAGITVGGAGATLNYTHATTSWDMNKPLNVTGNIGVTGTVDGVDIAARDAILTSTTTTAGAALPKAGGAMTGVITGFESTGIDDNASSTSITLLGSGTVGVGGTGSSYGKLTITQSTDASTGGLGIVDSGNALSARLFSTGTEITLNAGNTGTGKLVLNAGGGNVGIGVTPSHSLDILKSGSGDATVNIKSTTGGDPTIIFNSAAANRSGLLKFQDNGTNVGRIEYVHNGDRIDFQAGSATGATMSMENGKVGFGTTSPTEKLEVAGTALVENAKLKAIAKDISDTAVDVFVYDTTQR